MEKWLPVPEYKGLYEVSDHGRVRSLARTILVGEWVRKIPTRILKLNYNRLGYASVDLYKNKVSKTFRVHTLVLTAFVGERPEGNQVCHSPDNNPSNNRLENLRWGTVSENHDDMVRHGTSTYGARNPSAKLNDDDVRRIRVLLTQENPMSRGAIAKMYGVVHRTIGMIANGRNWKHVK